MKETIRERREKLTEEIIKARKEWLNARALAKYEVRVAYPKLLKEDWVRFYDLVDNDTRVMVANARLLALCDAANIIGAEIG